jgi:hypothetical protein
MYKLRNARKREESNGGAGNFLREGFECERTEVKMARNVLSWSL